MDQMKQDTSLPGSVSSAGRAGLTRVRLGDCLVSADLDRIVAPRGETALEPKAMAVLVYLIEHAGKVVSAGELIDAVWHGRPMGDNPVYRCIAQLRRALGDDARTPTYIATVPTKGYRLIAPIETLDPGLGSPRSPETDRSPGPAPLDVRPTAPSMGRFSLHRWGLAALLALLVALMILAVLLWRRVPGPSAPSAGSTPGEPVTLAVFLKRNQDGGS